VENAEGDFNKWTRADGNVPFRRPSKCRGPASCKQNATACDRPLSSRVRETWPASPTPVGDWSVTA